MNIITIPKKIISKGDLVIIPRSEYESLLKKKEKDWIYDSAVVAIIKKRMLEVRNEHKLKKTKVWSKIK